MRFLKVLVLVLQIILIKVTILPAQTVSGIMNVENRFQLLLSQFELYLDLMTIPADIKILYETARTHGKAGEYEIGAVLLEEALSLLQETGDSDINGEITDLTLTGVGDRPVQNNTFDVSLISGLDFNRQEFEIGFVQDDSTVLEEINKPYVGIKGQYRIPYGQNAYWQITNSLRYDQDNWRDDYEFRWQPGLNASLQYSGYWNDSKTITSNSFWEHIFRGRYQHGSGSGFSWQIRNDFHYKNYRSTGSFFKDFFRNSAYLYAEIDVGADHHLGGELASEFNENIDDADNDYLQNSIRLSIRKDLFQSFTYNIDLTYALRDYTILFEEDLIDNTNQTITNDLRAEIPLFSSVRSEVENSLIFKRYDVQSTLEPDYNWNFLRPSLIFQLNQDIDLGIGYELELKRHLTIAGDTYDVSEQDYNSNGAFLSVNYFNQSGWYISGTLSYQWRRYNQSITNDLISLYSNRNIFSVFFVAYAPITKNLTLNAFITYDNDNDIDKDHQNSQSTIFSVEVEYGF